jgi:hypothetical protein
MSIDHVPTLANIWLSHASEVAVAKQKLLGYVNRELLLIDSIGNLLVNCHRLKSSDDWRSFCSERFWRGLTSRKRDAQTEQQTGSFHKVHHEQKPGHRLGVATCE